MASHDPRDAAETQLARRLLVQCPVCDWESRLPSDLGGMSVFEAARSLANLHALRHLDRELRAPEFDFELLEARA